ncbi:hypothetical protein, partial [Ursidibacter sp. B-7004-1]
MAIFSFSQLSSAQEATSNNYQPATAKPIINEPDSGVRAINATGSIFATFNSAYTIDSTWEWKKWNDKHNAYHFVTEMRDKTHGATYGYDIPASYIHALNDQGNVAGGFSHKSVSLEVPTIWKWQNGKWSEPIELPTSETNTIDDQHMAGSARGLNGLGNRAVGYEFIASNRHINLATVWTEEGDNWAGIRLSLEESTANAINNKGDIVAGHNQNRASIWRHNGTDWSDAQVIDNNHSRLFALNNAGDVAGGAFDLIGTSTEDDNEPYVYPPSTFIPAIWSGNNYSEKTILKGVDGNETYGEVRALSADGKIAGGRSKVGENYRATIWSGNDWKAYDLGTFKKDGAGSSLINVMNDDGTIVGGKATFEDGESYAALWFIQYDENGKPTTYLLTDESNIPDIPSATDATTDTAQPTDATQPGEQPAPLNPSAAST